MSETAEVVGLDAREEWLKKLQQAASGPKGIRDGIPRHVLERLASVLQLRQVTHVENSVKGAERFTMSGQLLVFTEDLMAVTTVTGIDVPHWTPGRREGTTQVLLLPRRDLAALEMTQDGETYENSASVWETDQIPGDGSWPYHARVTVRYKGLAEPLTLPFDDVDNEGFAEFLPTLIADLTR